MVATKTIVIAGVITVICVTALVVGVVLGTRSYGCTISTAPTEVTVTHNTANTLIAWQIPEEDEDCEGSYRLSYQIDGGAMVTRNITDLELLEYSIDLLELCRVLTVHIYPVNEDGEANEEHFMQSYEVKPGSIPAVTNIAINTEQNPFQITWTRPANIPNCAISYRVTVERDGVASAPQTITATTLTIQDSSFCFDFKVSIVAVYETQTSPAAEITYQTPGVENILTAPSGDNPSLLTTSWSAHPKATSCELQYRVVYTVSGVDRQPVIATATTAFFPIQYCADSQLTVTAFNGERSTRPTTSDATQTPREIQPVSGLTFTDGVLSWTPPPLIQQCAVRYILNFNTDNGPNQDNTIQPSYEVPDNFYCFWFAVQVSALIGEISSVPSSYTHNAGPIPNLIVRTSPSNPQQYIAKWDAHPRQELCNLRYRITYTVDDIVEFEVQGSDLTATFDIVYCGKGLISVVAFTPTYFPTTPALVEVRAYPINLPSVSAVSVNDRIVTWTGIPAIGRCIVTYIVDVDGDMGEKIYDTVDTRYEVPYSDYCFTFTVGISPMINGVVGAPIYEEFYDAFPLDNFDVTESNINSDQLTLSWTPHPKQELCSLRYKITYTAGGRIEFTSDIEGWEATIDKVYCVEGEISVIAFNDDGLSNDPAIEDMAEENPSEIREVSGINIRGTYGNLLLTWTPPPYVRRCAIIYAVRVDAEIYNTASDIQTTNFLIYDFTYCFMINAKITPKLGDLSGNTAGTGDYKVASSVTNIQIQTSSTNPDQLTVTWTPHPKDDTCTSRYEVTYSINGEKESQKEVQESEATIDKVYCASGQVSVVGISNNGDYSDIATANVAEENPSEIGAISDVVIKNVEGELVAFWIGGTVGRCAISYELHFVTDLEPVDRSTEATSFQIPDEIYCFVVKVEVTPTFGSITGGSASSEEYTYGAKVDNLQIQTSPSNSDQLTVTWLPHPKEMLCSLRYRYTYSIDGITESTSELAETEVTFDKVYCASGQVILVAFNDDGFSSEVAIEDVPEENPSEIGDVLAVIINVEDGELVASWTAVPTTGRCVITYELNFDTDLIDDVRNTEATSFPIPDEIYCFTFNVEVTPTLGSTSGGSANSGQYTYDAIVRNIQIRTSPSNSDQLTVTWLAHPKETLCTLRYRYTYSIDDKIESTSELEETEVTFDKVYCASGELSIVAFNNDGISTEPAIEDVPAENPTSITSVIGLRIHNVDNLGDLVVNWTAPPFVQRCPLTYDVGYRTDLNTDEFNIESTTFTMTNDLYCFEVNLGVYPRLGNLLGRYQGTGDRIGSTITNLQVDISRSNPHQFTATWDPHPKESLCSMQYKVTYTIFAYVEFEDVVEATTVDFNNGYCSPGVVRVAAVTEDDESTAAEAHVEEYPTAVSGVSNLQVREDGFVSWARLPNMGRCVTIYVVDIESDIGHKQYTTQGDWHLIPPEDYCLTFIVNVAARIVDVTSVSSEATLPASAVTDLQVQTSSTNPDQLTVTWTPHPKDGICISRYDVTYTVNGEVESLTTAEESEATIDKVYCASGQISVVAVGNNGVPSEIATENVAEENPSEIGAVSNVDIKYVEGELVADWMAPPAVGRCAISYGLHFVTDIDPIDRTTQATSFPIPDEIYCFTVEVEVTPTLGTTTGGSASSDEYRYGAMVDNLQVQTSPSNSDQLTVTWLPHPKQGLCTLRYRYTYSIDEQTVYTSELDETEATFDKVYCASGQVSVVAFNDNEFSSEPAIQNVPEENPSEIGGVSNVVINNVEGELVASWIAPAAVGRCAISYGLHFVTDLVPVDRTTQENSFPIPDEIYCFTFNVEVTPTLGSTSGGSASSQQYTDGAMVDNLQVQTSPSNSDQLTATWLPHPKQALCALRYRYTYSIDGQTVYTSEVDETEATFDKVYCASGQVSVVAFKEGGASNEPAVQNVPEENPSEIGGVSNVVINNVEGELVASWIAPAAVGRCAISYGLHFVTDIDPIDRTTQATSFPIPDEIYCFTVEVEVTPTLGSTTGASASSDEYTDASSVGNLAVVTSETNPDELTATWNPHHRAEYCAIRYTISYTIGESSVFSATIPETTATFDKAYCAEGVVRVVALNTDNLNSEPSTYVVPADDPTDLGTVLNIAINDRLVTWSENPALSRCEITYVVSLYADSGTNEYPAQGLSYEILNSHYCFYVRIGVHKVLGEAFGPYDYVEIDEASSVGNLAVVTSETNSDELTATWNPHHRAEYCAIRYTISYTIGESSVFSATIPETTATFDKAYCAEGVVRVVALNTDNLNSEPSTYVVPAEDPTDLGTVLNIAINDRLVTWSENPALSRCEITYVVSLYADSGTNEYPAQGLSYEILNSHYCFYVRIGVHKVLGEAFGPYDYVEIDEEWVIDGISLTPSPEVNTLTVTWPLHSKESQCEIAYTALYSYGGVDQRIPEASIPATFALEYCVEGTVTITGYSDAAKVTKSGTATQQPVTPTEIGSVQELNAESLSPNRITVTWEPPLYISQCTIQYELTAENPNEPGETDSCNPIDITTCEIQEFCEMTNIIVGVTSVEGTGLTNVPEVFPYSCQPIDEDIDAIHLRD